MERTSRVKVKEHYCRRRTLCARELTRTHLLMVFNSANAQLCTQPRAPGGEMATDCSDWEILCLAEVPEREEKEVGGCVLSKRTKVNRCSR